jgi:chaperone modulatory protein CbpM
MRSDEILHAALLEEAALSLEEFARACAAPPDWVRIHVASGALSVSGERPAAWRFGSRELWRARRMRALERDFGADPALEEADDLVIQRHEAAGEARPMSAPQSRTRHP